MKKAISILTACLLLVVGTACAQAASPTGYDVAFTENPTTGYTWKVQLGDENILTVADGGYVVNDQANGAFGVGGTHSWSLNGKAAGSTDVTFTLGQQWEGGVTEDTVVYTCTVDNQLNVTAVPSKGVPEKYMPGMTVVELKENQTTGYQWNLVADPEGILTLEKDEYLTDSSNTKEGAGGIHRWIFRGASAGEVTLTFTYVRAWEKDVKPAATVTFAYQVDDKGQVTQKQVGGDFDQYAADAVSGTMKK